MSTAKHSTGPWELVFFTAQGFEVKTKEGRTISTHEFPDRTDYANGLLTTAAPDLIEACKAALPWLIRLGDFIGNGDKDVRNPNSLGMRCDDILRLKAAIAKAEGDTAWMRAGNSIAGA